MNQLSQKEKENSLNEIRILASIESPYIISYKDAFYDNDSSCLCIVMDLAEGGDLLKLIKKQINTKDPQILFMQWNARKGNLEGPESHVIRYNSFQKLFIVGLKALHDLKIVHRDLKGANVFIGKDQTYLLGDLNVSKVAKQGFVRTQTGTPYYASPEVWSDQPYDSKCDIWSLGCILYEMATGAPPFRAQDLKSLFQKIKKGQYDPIPKVYSADLSIIIKELLQVNPKSRPDCDSLIYNPIVMRRCVGTNILNEQIKRPTQQELLNTIKLPKNLQNLIENLPKSKFNDKKQNSSFEEPNLQKNYQVASSNRRGSNHDIQKNNYSVFAENKIQIVLPENLKKNQLNQDFKSPKNDHKLLQKPSTPVGSKQVLQDQRKNHQQQVQPQQQNIQRPLMVQQRNLNKIVSSHEVNYSNQQQNNNINRYQQIPMQKPINNQRPVVQSVQQVKLNNNKPPANPRPQSNQLGNKPPVYRMQQQIVNSDRNLNANKNNENRNQINNYPNNKIIQKDRVHSANKQIQNPQNGVLGVGVLKRNSRDKYGNLNSNQRQNSNQQQHQRINSGHQIQPNNELQKKRINSGYKKILI